MTLARQIVIPRKHRQIMAATAAGLAAAISAAEPAPQPAESRRVVLVAGARDSHGYDTHAHQAACRLIAAWLRQAVPSLAVDVCIGWPKDAAMLADADAVVLYCDGLGGHEINGHEEQVKQLTERGVGLGVLHYATTVSAERHGDLMLKAIGGYYETNWSVNPCWTANFGSLPDHPVTRGVRPFRIWDEWYYHMRFRPDLDGVTPLLSDLPPAATLKRPDGPHSNNPDVRAAVLERSERQHVAWVYDRENGGRGFGFTGGHRAWNFVHDDFRKLILNAIAWLAEVEIPAHGIESPTPTLDQMVEALGPPPAKWSRARTEELLEELRRPAE